MTKQAQQDNQTYHQKKRLRQHAISLLAEQGIELPVVMETHGGNGVLYRALYRTFKGGVVMEKKPARAAHLALQRPTWAVYECTSEQALAEGVGGHVEVTLLDCDPYGQIWETTGAFFSSERPFAPVMALVVNDGLRSKLRVGGAWTVKSLRGMVEQFGNDLYPIYLEMSKALLIVQCASAGYTVEQFHGYYCGDMQNMTHWLALLRRA